MILDRDKETKGFFNPISVIHTHPNTVIMRQAVKHGLGPEKGVMGMNKLMSISAIRLPAVRAKLDIKTFKFFFFFPTVSDVEIPKAQET